MKIYKLYLHFFFVAYIIDMLSQKQSYTYNIIPIYCVFVKIIFMNIQRIYKSNRKEGVKWHTEDKML